MNFTTDDVRIVPLPQAQDVLTDLLRQGAQQLLAQAINAEVADWIERHQHCRDAEGLWEKEYQDWSKRSLAGKQYVYVGADGVYFNIRLEGDRQCILVLMGSRPMARRS